MTANPLRPADPTRQPAASRPQVPTVPTVATVPTVPTGPTGRAASPRGSWRRLAWGVVAGALVAGALTVGPVPAQATGTDPGLTGWSVQPMGTYITTTASFAMPHQLWSVVSVDPLPASSPGHFQAGHGTTIVSNHYEQQARYSQSVPVKNLKPNSYYWVNIYTRDYDNDWVLLVRNQLTRTKERVVRLHWDRVRIWDDGDPMGCGEIMFKLQVNGAWGSQQAGWTSRSSMCNPQEYTMNITSPWVVRNGSTITAYALGEDDDTPDFPALLCTAGFGGCGDNAALTVTLPLPDEFNDGYSKPFQLWATKSGGLNFQWTGRYVTTYV